MVPVKQTFTSEGNTLQTRYQKWLMDKCSDFFYLLYQTKPNQQLWYNESLNVMLKIGESKNTQKCNHMTVNMFYCHKTNKTCLIFGSMQMVSLCLVFTLKNGNTTQTYLYNTDNHLLFLLENRCVKKKRCTAFGFLCDYSNCRTKPVVHW